MAKFLKVAVIWLVVSAAFYAAVYFLWSDHPAISFALVLTHLFWHSRFAGGFENGVDASDSDDVMRTKMSGSDMLMHDSISYGSDT